MNRIEEKEAYLVLQCLWSQFDNDFYSSESPDLKNDTKSIGIEITQSTLDIKERINYLAKELHRIPNKENRSTLEVMTFYDKDNIYENYKDELQEDDLQNLEKDIFDNTKKLIDSKISKFQKTYSKYDTNGLFVFIRNYEIDKTHVYELCKYFQEQQQKNNDKIQILFIHDIDTLYIYDIKRQNTQEIAIDEDTKNIIYNIL